MSRARFHSFQPDETTYRPDDKAYDVSTSGGTPDSFDDPDFSFRQFRSNLVVRWEYRPGATLFLVWSQGRTSSADSWEGSFARNYDTLFGTRPDNVFLAKVTYWFSL